MNMPRVPHFHMPHLPKTLHLRRPSRLEKVEAPQFLGDLYRDLRDRRLLPVAAVLIAAILAVPVFLASGSSPAPAPQAPPAISATKSPVVAALIAANHGVREIGKHGLGTAKDPFLQQFRVTDTSGSALGVTAAAGPTSTVGGALGLGDGGSTGDSSVLGGGGGGSSSGGSGGSSGSGGGAGSSPSDPGGTLGALTTYAINTHVGETGSSQLQSRNDVGYVAFLPSESKPVFVYVGASQNGSKAFFLLPGALSLSGDADCLLPVKPAGCQLIAMKPGDSETVVYTGDGKTYRLKLDSIKAVQVP